MDFSFKQKETVDTLVALFQDRTLPANEWTHEAHLVVGLWHLKNFTLAEATCMLRSGIITYNLASGGENTPERGYHETLTLLWIKIIHNFVKKNKDMPLLDLCNAFLSSPYADRSFPFEFYTRNTLMSTEARAFWVEPDLKNLIFS